MQVEEYENVLPRKTMGKFAMPMFQDFSSSITRPVIQANNFELKPSLIHMLQNVGQFNGLPNEDTHLHLQNFLEICDTIKFNRVSHDAIRLRLFLFSLRDKAKAWLTSLPVGSITTWKDMAHKFLSHYFPPSKSAKMKNDITTFVQIDGKSLYEAWERYKELIRLFPYHGLPVWMQVQTFYNVIHLTLKSTIDVAAGGSINHKSPEEAYTLIEEMTANSYQWPSERFQARKAIGVHEVETMAILNTKMDAITKMFNSQMNNVLKIQGVSYDFCGGDHRSNDCQVETTLLLKMLTMFLILACLKTTPTQIHIIQGGGTIQTYRGD